MAGLTLEQLQSMGAKPTAATSQTPRLLEQGTQESSSFSPKPGAVGLTIEQLQRAGAKPVAPQPPQTQEQLNAYKGPVETTSPLSATQRAGVSTEPSVEGRKNILKNMGFEPLEDAEGNLLVRYGDKVHPVDEKGFSIGDLADFAGGQLPIIGNIAGMAVGTALAVPTLGAANPIIGGAVGAGIGEFIKQKIAQKLGSGEKTKKGELAIQTGIGALTSAIPGGKIVQSLLPDAVMNKLISTTAKTAIEDAVVNEFMKSGNTAAATKLYNNLISNELSKSMAGRAAMNVPVGGVVGGAQGGLETAYQGGTPSEIAQGTLYGAGTGALLAPVLGEAFHQTIGRVGRTTTKPTVTDRVYTEFQGKKPSIEEIKSFVDSLPASAGEKASVYDYLSSLAPKVEGPPAPGSFRLSNEPISFNELSDKLVSAGYKNAIKVLEKMEKEVPSTLHPDRTPATWFENIPEVIGWLNKELPNIGKKEVTAAKPTEAVIKTIAPEQSVTKTVLPKEIAGAQPRYGSGKNLYKLKFANDADKALYIIANQKTKSAAHDLYMEWLKTQFPGETEAQIIKRGQDVKSKIKTLASSKPDTDVLAIKSINEAVKTKSGLLKLTPEQAKIGLQPEVPVTPIKQTTKVTPATPIVSLEQKPVMGTVDINKIHQNVAGANTLTEQGGIVNKVVDWLATPADNIMNPNEATSRFGRALSRTFSRLGNTIKSLGPIGEDVANTLGEVTRKTSQLAAVARDGLKVAIKTINSLTQSEKEELVQLMSSNRRSNPALEGRELYSLEELQSQASSVGIQKAIKEVFDITSEISKLRGGTPYRDSSGNIVYRAGSPKPYWPTFFEDESRYYTSGRNEVLLEQRTQSLIDQGQPPEIAKANALAGISEQSKHSSEIKIQQAAEMFYPTHGDLVKGGIVVDPADALQRMISRDTRQAALVDVLSKKGVPAVGENEVDTTPFDIAKRYSNKIKENIDKAIDEHVDAGKMDAQEGSLQKEVLKGYIDVVLKGADVNKYIQTIKKLNGYKLSLSVFRNFLQPMNNFLNTDFPSFAKGFASAYGLNKLPGLGSKTTTNMGGGRNLAVKSGSYSTELIEPIANPVHNKVLNTVLKPMTAVEGKNRISSAVSGLNFAETLAKAMNESTSLVKRMDAASRLKQLIGRDIAPNDYVVLTEKDLLNAAYNNTKATQFGYDPLNLPGWVSGTAYGQITGQFKSYAYNQLGLMFNSTVGELRSGNPGRATRNLLAIMAIYAPTQIAMDSFLNFITGKETEEDLLSIKTYLLAAASIISGGWADNIIRAPDGKSFVLSVVGGPSGTTSAQTYDAIANVIGDAGDGDGEAALEDIYKFGQQQGGGAARVIGNITDKTLGF